MPLSPALSPRGEGDAPGEARARLLESFPLVIRRQSFWEEAVAMADQIETRSVEPGSRGGWGIVLALLLLLSVLWIVSVRRQPPAPTPASAPPAAISGARALAGLRALVGDGSSHPVGSPANAAVRDRVLAQLRQAGYAPEIQSSFVCSAIFPNCVQAENIVARLEGTARDGAILLMAH